MNIQSVLFVYWFRMLSDTCKPGKQMEHMYHHLSLAIQLQYGRLLCWNESKLKHRKLDLY